MVHFKTESPSHRIIMTLLQKDPEAARLHAEGLLAADVRHDYTLAHESYRAAQNALEASLDSYLLGLLQGRTDPVIDDIHASIQEGCIQRDDGFAYLYESVAAGKVYHKRNQKLIQAHHELEIAGVRVGSPLLSGWDTQPIGPEIYHEQGKVLNRLARLATAAIVFRRRYEDGDPQSAGYALKREYTKAHEHLQKGDMSAGQVEIEVNALTAARHEFLFGDTGTSVEEWLGRAASALAWTAEHDPGNLKSAKEIMYRRKRHLRSYKTAENSVLKHP